MNVLKYDIVKFCDAYNKEYEFLYNARDNVAGFKEAVDQYDMLMDINPSFKLFVKRFTNYRKDYITSDRECAAFMFALLDIEE